MNALQNNTILNELEPLMAQVIEIADVELIYLNEDKLELLIMISNKSGKVFNELMPALNMVFTNFPLFSFRLFQIGQVQQSIRRNNLFFYSLCRPGNLKYKKPASNYNLHEADKKLSTLIQWADKHYSQEMLKRKSFQEGALFYLDKGQLEQSVFMLHQGIELIFRLFEVLAMGNDKKTHSIRNHQLYISNYIPELGALFSLDNPEASLLLNLLDESYLAVRYESDFKIDIEELNQLLTYDQHLENSAEQIFRKIISAFKEKYTEAETSLIVDEIFPEQAPESHVPEIDFPDHLLDRILQEIEVLEIYCFAKKKSSLKASEWNAFCPGTVQEIHKSHYYLLVVTNTYNTNFQAFQRKLDQSSQPVAVTLLFHSKSEFYDLSGPSKQFFRLVRAEGINIYRFTTQPFKPKHNEQHIVTNSRDVLTYYNRCNSRAKSFFESAKYAASTENLDVSAFLIAESVQQFLLGMIHVFLGYKPNQVNLFHLLDLCSLFTNLTEDIFPYRNPAEKNIFQLMSQIPKNIKYKNHLKIESEEILVLIKKCERLLKTADQLSRAKLIQLLAA